MALGRDMELYAPCHAAFCRMRRWWQWRRGSSSPPPTGSASTFNQARGFNDSVTGIVPVNDGSGDVIVAGFFTTYTGVVSNRLIRLHADGTVAQAFPDGFNDFVLNLISARDSTGAMYALGSFTQF